VIPFGIGVTHPDSERPCEQCDEIDDECDNDVDADV